MYFQSHSKTTMMAVPIPKAIMAPKIQKMTMIMASKIKTFRLFEPIDIGVILGLRMIKNYFLLWFLLHGVQHPQIAHHGRRRLQGMGCRWLWPISACIHDMRFVFHRLPFLKHPTDKPVDCLHKGKD
jgi:hypothetical protein